MKRAVWLLALAGCGKSEDPEGLSRRELRPEHRELVVRFAEAVVRKDYKAAYKDLSATYDAEVGWDGFLESIGRYRDRAEADPTFTLSATEDDPKRIAEDSLVELMVPRHLRGKIAEEVAVSFDLKGEEGWTLVCWIVDEGGTWKILNYYQDD
ncbi:MAG TPA: hypothetical protein VF950_25000 [Planctomycetota bacterium]